MKGEFPNVKEEIQKALAASFQVPGGGAKKHMFRLAAIAAGAAVLMNLTGVFRDRQIRDTGFLIFYSLTAGIGLNAYRYAAEWVEQGILRLTDLMRAVYPAYFIALTAARGTSSSIAFYQVALLLILLVEEVIGKILLPGIHLYVILRVCNTFHRENGFSKAAEFLELLIGWAQKGMLGGIIGMNLIQGMIAPVIDVVKRTVLIKGAEAIPGIGGAVGGTAEVAMGTAVLVKNSIGAAGLIVCLLIFLTPLSRVLVITVLYKLTAAIIQPFSDQRMTDCISGIGDGCRLLLKAAATGGLLFMITIAVASYTTTLG